MAAARGNSARTGRAKASPSTEPASPAKTVTDSECAPNFEHLWVMLNQLKGDICGKIDSLSCELRADISSVREELRHAIEPMQQKLSSHDQTITELQRACTDHSDLLTSLDSTVCTLKAEVKLLTDKCEDLEVAKKRAAFTDVKRLLHSCPGVKFGLRFPATLKITLPGGATHTFEDPATAMDFAKEEILRSHPTKHKQRASSAFSNTLKLSKALERSHQRSADDICTCLALNNDCHPQERKSLPVTPVTSRRASEEILTHLLKRQNRVFEAIHVRLTFVVGFDFYEHAIVKVFVKIVNVLRHRVEICLCRCILRHLSLFTRHYE
ncbi:hypothetical protein E1301_Tti019579 [Triplophysa tibetana]|uniref:Uncharacterized protein n=1 Tax=Triplophysa tibetana TaxID=1572043 RepID=A0A5A9NZ27_9TELE|nr:hypothetical protein E1301_Tti019579 [Triplophysa tibetana]